MTDPIKALIAAFDAVHDAYIESDFIDKVMEKHFKAGFEAIAAIAAAEARPEPKPDPALRDWPEDLAHENGNYTNTCVSCKERFIGYKRRVVCKVCAQKASSEPAAEPSDKVAVYLQSAADCRMNKTTDDWQELTMMYLADAVEALAREVRR